MIPDPAFRPGGDNLWGLDANYVRASTARGVPPLLRAAPLRLTVVRAPLDQFEDWSAALLTLSAWTVAPSLGATPEGQEAAFAMWRAHGDELALRRYLETEHLTYLAVRGPGFAWAQILQAVGVLIARGGDDDGGPDPRPARPRAEEGEPFVHWHAYEVLERVYHGVILALKHEWPAGLA